MSVHVAIAVQQPAYYCGQWHYWPSFSDRHFQSNHYKYADVQHRKWSSFRIACMTCALFILASFVLSKLFSCLVIFPTWLAKCGFWEYKIEIRHRNTYPINNLILILNVYTCTMYKCTPSKRRGTFPVVTLALLSTPPSPPPPHTGLLDVGGYDAPPSLQQR